MLTTTLEQRRSPMITVDVDQAEKSLRELLEKVEAGEELVITRNGEPVAHVHAAPKAERPKKPIDFERLAALRARVPPLTKDAGTLIREMRDEERY